jgi:uncharacterized membrane protein YhaH (DUF805 family)
MEIFLDVVKNKYAEFNGRARRNEYWMYVLFNILLTIVGYAIIGIGVAAESMIIGVIGYIVLLIIGLGLLIPSLAVAVRRLHDTNKSGWMLLLGLVPFVGFIILLIILATEGTKGPNNYGPDPKNPHDDINTIGKDELV